VKKNLIVVIAVLGVLAAALAALPYWFGMQAEAAYEAMLAEMTKNGDLTVSSKNIQRGWLDSTIDTTFTVTGAPVTITALHRVSHGPLPLDDAFEFQPLLAKVKSDLSIAVTGSTIKLPPLKMTTVVYLAGNSHAKLAMDPAKTTSGDSTLEWKGLTGTVDTSADYRNSKWDVSAPLLAISGKTGSMNLNRIKLTADQTKSPSGFDVGTANVAVDKISADGATGKTTVDGFALSTKTDETGGSLNTGFTVQFREAEAAGSKQGAGQINIQIRKLDVPTLVKFRGEFQALRKQKIPQEQASMMMLGKTLELLGALAKKSPELEISKLTFKSSEGEISGKARFVLDGSQLDVSGNPMLMLRALSGEGEVSLPESLVRLLAKDDVKRDIEALKKSGKLKKKEIEKLTPQRIEFITREALKELPQYRDSVVSRLKLVPDGPNYKIVGVLKNGQVTVNNEPIQLP
jgi:uncharacterized protein YdgA (DUF945 family)